MKDIERSREQMIEYLLARSETTDSGCIEWTGSRNAAGYGQLSADSLADKWGSKGTHRLMYHLVTGHVYSGRQEQILHSCHNRACMNPDHLSLGTPVENMRQASERGSLAIKMTVAKVQSVHRLHAAGLSRKEIAYRMDVGVATIASILKGETWRHVAKPTHV